MQNKTQNMNNFSNFHENSFEETKKNTNFAPDLSPFGPNKRLHNATRLPDIPVKIHIIKCTQS